MEEKNNFPCMTENHLVRVIDKGWIKVKDLEVDDEIVSDIGEQIYNAKIIRISNFNIFKRRHSCLIM